MAKETYVETIYALINFQGSASVTEIATILEVKPSSVTEMLRKLDDMDFVNYKPYCNVTLTDKGTRLAVFLKQMQLSLQAFFEALNINEHVAETDACKIEHILHTSTLQHISIFVDVLQNTPQGKALLDVFQKTVQTRQFVQG